MKRFLRVSIIVILAVITVCSLPFFANAEAIDVGIPVEEHPELFGRTMPTRGEGKVLVFLIQFSDYKNDDPTATAEYYNELYFSAEPLNGTKADGPWYGSVASFYRDQSMGKLSLSGEVFDWYTAKNERAYYNSWQKKKELVMEAVAYYEAKGEDLSRFDGDKNGELDAVVFHFAGPADDAADAPWYDGSEYSAYVGEIKSGQKINSLIQLDNSVNKADSNSETLRRTICHELMHTLGMRDLYGVMWFGLRPVEDLTCEDTATINPYYKMLLGWTNKVTLVTSDTLGFKLNEWSESGETVIVTDKFNGVFDEFYMIAYTRYCSEGVPQIRIWHVDARLNAEKTGFLYDNYYYTPEPENSSHAGGASLSSYPFLAEVSSVPEKNGLIYTKDLYFREGSTLGPGGIPSTDTHDGRYTGIKIDGFKIADTYAAMDITFGNKDTSAPELWFAKSSLGFFSDNKLSFNEYVYPSDNWSGIHLTDTNGNVIPAKITRSHFPQYEITVLINGEIPEAGFNIVLPEGAIEDSSGNKNKALTVPVSAEKHIFEQSKTFVPWYYENRTRFWETYSYSFSDGKDSVVITATGEGGVLNTGRLKSGTDLVICQRSLSFIIQAKFCISILP